ncbi:MAG: hypothetical protein IT233_11635 [Bacteroidia bacterium]|nr:hypothetical protein [Bacteroidia bacterium]
MFDDSEKITLKIEGISPMVEDDSSAHEKTFVKKEMADNGSIRIKSLPCR